jgi:membrane dipeptidase
MRTGGFAGGFFAIYIPSPRDDGRDDAMDNPPFALPLPPPIDATEAQPVALAMAGHLMWMERAAEGAFRICRTAAEIRDSFAQGTVAAIMHMEGAEAIGADLDQLHVWHAMGLRSLGPVWSRPTAFGHGVPFRYPSGPDTGPGLTEAGRDLVRLCNELRILIDLSHLNEAGFDDVAALSDAPLVATHSNAHAVTPSSRNLTDRQLALIRERRGMVGLNYAAGFLNADGRPDPETGWDPLMRHLDHLLGQLGEDHVGLGSDFDGATIPDCIGDVTGLPALQATLAAHGYDRALLARLCHANWIDVLERSWGG